MWQNRRNSEFVFNIDINLSEIVDQSYIVVKLKITVPDIVKSSFKSTNLETSSTVLFDYTQ
jgi:hypothetical protein